MLKEWHKILGHTNKADVLKFEAVVDDMKITSKDDFERPSCIVSKQVVSCNRTSDERASAPMEFLHRDVAGPIEPTANDGFRYAINFVDDFTGACFVYFLKQKCDATRALKKFLCDIAPYGKLKRMRSDNGGEYISEKFENVLIQHQVRHEFSAPHSPHQNGTAERNWHTIFEIARGMLIESKLPKFLWTYAVMAAAHIRNRMYCQRIKETPYRLLTGKKLIVRKLHVFGSVCYANVHQKKKLEPRSRKGFFVGYDKYSPSYLVYFPESKSIMKNITVNFTENFDSDVFATDMNNHTLDADLVSMENPCQNIYTNFDTPFDTFIRFHDESSLNRGKTQQDNSEDSHQVTQANNAVISNDMEVVEFEEDNVEVITREDGKLPLCEYPDSEKIYIEE